MKRGQGLPISTVVLIVIGVAVLAVITIFFLGGFGSGQAATSGFQCQATCQQYSTLIQGKQMCCAYNDLPCLQKTIAKGFCSGKCADKISCALPNINNGCGYDRSAATSTCLKCDQQGNPTIGPC